MLTKLLDWLLLVSPPLCLHHLFLRSTLHLSSLRLIILQSQINLMTSPMHPNIQTFFVFILLSFIPCFLKFCFLFLLPFYVQFFVLRLYFLNTFISTGNQVSLCVDSKSRNPSLFCCSHESHLLQVWHLVLSTL